MSRNPAELLFGSYRRKVLSLLLLGSMERLHVRAIARRTGVPPGSLHRELKHLAEFGILLRERSGNQVFYRANPDCPVLMPLRALLRKSESSAAGSPHRHPGSSRKTIRIGADIVVSRMEFEALLRSHHVTRLALFGSAARAEMQANSDVDLLVEFEEGKKPSLGGMVLLRDELTALLGRPVDLATSAILRNPYRRRSILRDLEELYAA